MTEFPDERLIAAARTGVWDPTGDGDPRRLETTARDPAHAWRELAGARDAPVWSPLFHVKRHGSRRAWRLHRATALALRVAGPSHAIPPARYIDHPPTVAAAVRFSQAAVRAQRAELLARQATDRLDALGTSITPGPIVHVARSVVWTAHAVTASRQTERTALLLAKLLIVALVDGSTIDTVGEHLAGVIAHDAWWGERSVKCLALGALAWRELARRGRGFPPTIRDCGAKLYVAPGVAGQPIASLADPFEPMFAMLDLGVRIVAYSDEAVAIELAEPI